MHLPSECPELASQPYLSRLLAHADATLSTERYRFPDETQMPKV